MLAKLKGRDRSSPTAKKRENMLVFKCPFGPHLRHLAIRRECFNLINRLRRVLGGDFLHDTRCILAHPVRSNFFLKTYRYNHPSEVCPFVGGAG